MKKILFVMNSLSTGGAEKVLVNILNHVSKDNYEITLLTVFNNSSESNILESQVQRKSIVNVQNKYIQGALYKIYSKILSPKQLYSRMIYEKYDIEIAFLEGLPTKIISGSTNQKSKKIAWVHIDLMQFRDSDYCFRNEANQKKCYEKFNEIVSVSCGVKKAFEERFYSNVHTRVLYNPIDEEEVLKKSKMIISGKQAYKTQDFRFVSVGRLHYQKRYDRLIEASDILRKQGFKFEACIVGEGEEREKLEKMIQKYNLEEYVRLYGYSSNPYQIMAQANCMVISSLAEGFPVVSVEALILGIPVIATNVTGSREALENGKWGIMTENNTEAIAKAMKNMMNPETYGIYCDLAKERGEQFKIKEAVEAIQTMFAQL